MDKEIRLTLIATGFDTSRGMDGLNMPAEVVQYLKSLKQDEAKLDAPSFLRSRQFERSRRLTIPATKLERAPATTPAPSAN